MSILGARNWTLALLKVAVFSSVLATFGSAQGNSNSKPAGKSSGSGRAVLYASVEEELTQYDIDFDNAALIKRGSVSLPLPVQEAARMAEALARAVQAAHVAEGLDHQALFDQVQVGLADFFFKLFEHGLELS